MAKKLRATATQADTSDTPPFFPSGAGVQANGLSPVVATTLAPRPIDARVPGAVRMVAGTSPARPRHRPRAAQPLGRCGAPRSTQPRGSLLLRPLVPRLPPICRGGDDA